MRRATLESNARSGDCAVSSSLAVGADGRSSSVQVTRFFTPAQISTLSAPIWKWPTSANVTGSEIGPLVVCVVALVARKGQDVFCIRVWRR